MCCEGGRAAEKGYRGWQGTLQNLDPNLVMFYCSSRHYSYNICNFNFLAATASCHQVIVPLILPITLLTSNSEKGSIPLVDAELDVLGELLIELLVVFGVLRQALEELQALLHQVLADDLEDLALLEHLAGDVEGEVFRAKGTTSLSW